jgi:DNA-directed RNA polymerase specialized sigma24 family protein
MENVDHRLGLASQRGLAKQIRDPRNVEAMRELDQFDRMVVVLHVLDKYTFSEIAEMARRPCSSEHGTVTRLLPP